MKTKEQLRQLLAAGQVSLSRHALHRMVERNISAEQLSQAGAMAEIIEDYPQDKYSPSCLLLGFTTDGVPLHIHVSREDNPTVKIITTYVPTTEQWDAGFKKRRQRP